MIIPVRHVVERELTDEECKELLELKNGYLNGMYELLIEPTIKQKTVPEHFHIHLIVTKDEQS